MDTLVRLVRSTAAGCDDQNCSTSDRYVVVPTASSQTFLDQLAAESGMQDRMTAVKVHYHQRHISLDDLDFDECGVMSELVRAVRQRGLDVWQINAVEVDVREGNSAVA